MACPKPCSRYSTYACSTFHISENGNFILLVVHAKNFAVIFDCSFSSTPHPISQHMMLGLFSNYPEYSHVVLLPLLPSGSKSPPHPWNAVLPHTHYLYFCPAFSLLSIQQSDWYCYNLSDIMLLFSSDMSHLFRFLSHSGLKTKIFKFGPLLLFISLFHSGHTDSLGVPWPYQAYSFLCTSIPPAHLFFQ